MYNYNLHFGGGSNSFSSSNIIVADPRFVNSSVNPSVADFKLQSNSPAINVGIATLSGVSAPTMDFINGVRPTGVGYDIGAYEFGATLGLESNVEKTIFSLYPNPAKNEVSINVEANSGDKIEVELASMLGQKVFSQSFIAEQQGQNILTIDSQFHSGVYGVKVRIGDTSKTQLLIVE
jgi:Secretion system C-terminal sorting domain